MTNRVEGRQRLRSSGRQRGTNCPRGRPTIFGGLTVVRPWNALQSFRLSSSLTPVDFRRSISRMS